MSPENDGVTEDIIWSSSKESRPWFQSKQNIMLYCNGKIEKVYTVT